MASSVKRPRAAARSKFRPAHFMGFVALALVAGAGYFAVRWVISNQPAPGTAPTSPSRIQELIPGRIVEALSGVSAGPDQPRAPEAGAMESAAGIGDAMMPPFDAAVSGLSVQTRDTLRLRYNLGLLKWHQNDTAGALASFQSVLDIDPQGQYGSRAFLQMGVIYHAARDYEHAINQFRKASILDAHDPLAAHNLGLALLHAGKTPEAVTELTRAAQLDGANAGILVNLGNAHLAAGNLPAAISAYRSAISNDPEGATARFNLGLALYKSRDLTGAQEQFARSATTLQGSDKARAEAFAGMSAYERGLFGEAARAFGRAAEDEPATVNYRFNEAVALAKSGMRADAAQSYRKALTVASSDAAAWFGLGGVLYMDGQMAPALEAYNHGLSLDSTSTSALFTSGYILFSRGELSAAVTRFNAVIERHGPEASRAWVNLGLCLEAQGNLSAAADAYAKGDPADPRTFYNLGLVRRRMNNNAGAAEAFQRAVQLKPADERYQAALGDAYLESGRPDAALGAYQKALAASGEEDFELLIRMASIATRLERSADVSGYINRSLEAAHSGPDKARAFLAEGVWFDRKGDIAAALTSFRRAVTEDRTNPDVYFNLGVVLARVQSWDESVGALRTAIRLKPDNAPAWTQLGNVFAARGLKDEAARAYSEAVRIDSATVDATFNLQELNARH